MSRMNAVFTITVKLTEQTAERVLHGKDRHSCKDCCSAVVAANA
jgi:hypothetical protein